jgi:ABC-type nitrate/sulfonate/bicarbonate transport system substrate-binding protein
MNVLAAMVLLVAGCGQDTAPRDGWHSMTLRVAMFPAGNSLPVHVAITDGIFERNGLHVELTEGTDLPVFLAALVKNQYDVVMTVPTLVLIGAEKRIDLQIISSLQRSSRERPNAVWITRDPSIRSLEQLKGKTIAVPSLTGIIVDSLVYLLARRGVDRGDVAFVQTPFPTMGDQLAAGNVDAAVATIPFSSAIAARGFAVHDDVVVEAVRDASGGSVDVAITTVWIAMRRFAADHPGAVTAWRTSLAEAIDSLYRNQPQARATMREWLKIPAAVAEHAPLPDWTVDLKPQELAPYITISKQVGTITTDPDVNALVWPGP